MFVETWMAGGLGRAQGAWDEMVFRSMVRDGSRFYDALGLVAEGTQIDFQPSVNYYLYGTRFLSWLGHTLFARGRRALGQPRRGQRGLLRLAVPSTSSARA